MKSAHARDSYTGFDYADQRYYASTYGRFNTPDPFSGSAKLGDPGSQNRYSYTRGDPVNRHDPTGLDDCVEQDDGTYDCGLIAIATGTTEGEDAGFDDASDFGDTPYPDGLHAPDLPMQGQDKNGKAKAAGIAAAINRYNLGLKSLISFTTSAPDCLKDLGAVGLTPAQVDSLASGAKFSEYTAAPPQTQINLILRNAILAADSKTQTIYYLPFNLVAENYGAQLGDLLHELIHLSGFGGTGSDQDTNLQTALKITVDATNTGNISAKLTHDCFKSIKNP